MTIREISQVIEASLVSGNDQASFDGVYVGDLLSRAMSHVGFDNLWVTIMSNTNVIAVATLTEPAAIVLAEDVRLSEDALANAKANGVTVLTTKLSAYEICARVARATGESDV